ncbi:MAG: PTS sugar transporter subunit IIB [Coprobacillaceae bacterium]
MIRILLCCGGGFSSSALATKMKKDIITEGMEEKVDIDFYPFTIAKDKYQDYDIIMCCPHLKMYIKEFIERIKPTIPLYVLPPRMYGMMNIKELYQDAKDVVSMYKETNTNPICFPGKENTLRVTRDVAFHNQ